MPYIEESRRGGLGYSPQSPGDINYQFTTIIDAYVSKYGLSYKTINEAVGALECAKLELYRRVAAPYEDKKCKENGDVYTVGVNND